MQGLLSFLMIILFVVAVVTGTIYSDDGLQSDAADMQNTTQKTIQEANDTLVDFGE